MPAGPACVRREGWRTLTAMLMQAGPMVMSVGASPSRHSIAILPADFMHFEAALHIAGYGVFVTVVAVHGDNSKLDVLLNNENMYQRTSADRKV